MEQFTLVPALHSLISRGGKCRRAGQGPGIAGVAELLSGALTDVSPKVLHCSREGDTLPFTLFSFFFVHAFSLFLYVMDRSQRTILGINSHFHLV